MKYRIEKKSACRIRLLSLGAALSVFGMGLFLTSCNDFYSTTWGDAFTRDPANVKVTSSNVNELLKDANGDTGASRAILEKLKETKDPKLQAAAVKAANQAAGLTGLALSNLGTITGDNAGNLDSLETLAKTILADAKKNDIKGVAADIASTLPVTPDNTPLFEGNFADSVSTSDLTLLLVTMMLAEIPADMNDFDEYAAKWGSEKRIDDKGTIRLSKTERVIAAIANTVSERPGSELGKMLENLVGNGN